MAKRDVSLSSGIPSSKNVMSEKHSKDGPIYEPGTAILAGDTFIAHSNIFIREVAGKNLDPPPQMSGQFLGSLIVSATSLALGIELYLKALRMKLGIRVPKTHHLLHLYDDLPEDIRTLIENRYDQIRPSAIGKASGLKLVIECGQVPQEVIKQDKEKTSITAPDNSLRAVLERSSDAFQTWRYLHEGGRNGELMTYNFEYGCLGAAATSIRTTLNVHVGVRKT